MNKIFSLMILCAAVLMVSSCRDKDNPAIPDLKRTVLPQFVKDTSVDVLIQDPATFRGRFNVGLYFANDNKPQKMDIVVVMNGDKSKIKTLKANVSSFPATIDVTADQLAQLFGKTAADIQTGDAFDIGADVTLTDGTFIPIFRTDGTEPYGGDAQNFPGSSLSIQYKKVCPLDINDLLGTFTVDDPDFWEASYPVTIALEGTNVLKITGWVQDPTAVIRFNVNLKTQEITVPKQVYLPTLPGTPYHKPAAEGTGTVDACATTMSVRLTNTVDEGSFGAATVELHK
ncbi:hypothetical protein F0L74_01495 [Chitinophaga agrisoli]|uniref:Uncharacterized protein n=1 Tax=Chitinophaga agrisoli TaxID=2607653 RepID=A0A5B2W033_9BACT|nr:hypothetical protein [Chitinophaga agrisoli]KAA2244675.1 hypothetical protein F0L74_01495 [Chitinophaga agrisoli]